MSFPSSELETPIHSPKSECVPPPPPRNQRGEHTRLRVRGWGGGSQFGRLEKKPSTVYSILCGLIVFLASGSDKNEKVNIRGNQIIFSYSLFPPVNVLGLASNDVRKRGANWTNLSHWVIPGDFRLGTYKTTIWFPSVGEGCRFMYIYYYIICRQRSSLPLPI